MKRERIEDIGCIKILIDEALDSPLFDGEEYGLNKIQDLVDLRDLKTKLIQIQAYADGQV